MLEAFMWLLVEAAIFGTVALAVLVVVRRVRHERWAQARARQQLIDGTHDRLQTLRAGWQRHGAQHEQEGEWW